MPRSNQTELLPLFSPFHCITFILTASVPLFLLLLSEQGQRLSSPTHGPVTVLEVSKNHLCSFQLLPTNKGSCRHSCGNTESGGDISRLSLKDHTLTWDFLVCFRGKIKLLFWRDRLWSQSSSLFVQGKMLSLMMTTLLSAYLMWPFLVISGKDFRYICYQ